MSNDGHQPTPDEEPLGRPYLVASSSVHLPEVETDGETDVRPYLLTGGRTAVDNPAIAMETVVVSTRPIAAVPGGARGRSAELVEKDAVVALCTRPLSVAEVAALRKLPLGVARVLVADLVADGQLAASFPGVAQAHDVAFIERLIAGVSAL